MRAATWGCFGTLMMVIVTSGCGRSERGFRTDEGAAGDPGGDSMGGHTNGGGSGSGGEGRAGDVNMGNAGSNEPGDAGAGGKEDGGEAGSGGASNETGVCGDAQVDEGEGCDDGVENGFELLRCAPDCSRIIEYKYIVLSADTLPNGDFDPNPVATADAQCPTGYKALFAHGQARRATTTPNTVSNPIDWTLQPYTYYVNADDNLIWMTDSVALLGIRNGEFVGLENSISGMTWIIATGMNADWTTLTANNCSGWTLSGNDYEKHYGFSYSGDIDFLWSESKNECSYDVGFYCVEQ